MSDPFLSSDEYDERAHQLYNEGQYDEAIDTLREGLGLYPHAVELLVGMGYARLAREEFAWARHAFEEARGLDPDHEDTLAGLGEVLLKFGERAAALTELEQDLAQARERVLVIGIETPCLFERVPRPRELLAREPRIAHTDEQLDGVGIQPQALAQGIYSLVVLAFVVELMCTFVIFVGTEERIRHRTGPPGKVVL